VDVVILRPDGFALPPTVMQRAQPLADKLGGTISETTDRTEAMRGAHVLYVKEWSSTRHYGDTVADKKLRDELTDWCVDEQWFQGAQADCRLMHSMPVRRGVAVQDVVLDGKRSVLTHQAENRMWSQMAVLHQLMR